MRRAGYIAFALTGGAMASGIASHAQIGSGEFTYSTSFSATTLASGQSQINILDRSDGRYQTINPTSGNAIVLTNLTATSTADDASPDHVNTDYSIAITLRNNINQTQSIVHTFTGHIDSTIATDGATSTNTFTGAISQVYDFTGFGGNNDIYNVTLTSYTGFQVTGGSPTSASQGAIGATVTLATPEPGALTMLGGMGVGGSIFAYRRRRRIA